MSQPFFLRSLLFVPGSRPERFAKALVTDADIVCIDLEDSVAPEDKGMARIAAVDALGDARLAVRINGLHTAAGLADILALLENQPDIVMIPMVESVAEIAIVHSILGPETALIPLIETVKGLAIAPDIAAAPGVMAMMFGGADFSSDLGVALAWEPLAVARSQFVMACASAKVTAIDVPWVYLDDAAGLVEEAARAKGLGFAAKSAIHPAQIDIINKAFAPSLAEVDEARAAIAAFDASGGSAVRFNGKMLETPMMPRYRHIIDLQESSSA